MNDPRSYQRFPVQLDVKLRVPGDTSAEMDAIVCNVSFRGLGIIASAELQPGTEISVEWPNPPFYYPGKAAAMCTVVGIVKEKEEGISFRLNVQFSDRDSELAQSLLHWVQMQVTAQRKAQASATRFSGQRKRIRF